MGLMEMFTPEEKVTLTYSEFYQLVKEATKAEMLFNGVKCKVSRDAMYAMVEGKESDELLEGKPMLIIGSVTDGSNLSSRPIKNDEPEKGDSKRTDESIGLLEDDEDGSAE